MSPHEIALLRRFHSCTSADQDALIVQSHLQAGRHWSWCMRGLLRALAWLCVRASVQRRSAYQARHKGQA